MTINELLAKGVIDVSDNINFRTHKEVMSLFGSGRINPMSSFYKHPHEDGVHIWFPIFYQDASNDWENTFGQNEESVFERRKHDNAGYLEEMLIRPDRHKRVLFAKIEKFGRVFYKFKGIYLFDAELSAKAKKAAYRRIASTAALTSSNS